MPCYVEYKEAKKNLESNLEKAGYKSPELGNKINVAAFKKHNDEVESMRKIAQEVIDKWNRNLDLVDLKGENVATVKISVYPGDIDAKVGFSRKTIKIEYHTDILNAIDEKKKELGIYDSQEAMSRPISDSQEQQAQQLKFDFQKEISDSQPNISSERIESLSNMIMNKILTKERAFYKKNSRKAKEDFFYNSEEEIRNDVLKETTQNIFKIYTYDEINSLSNKELIEGINFEIEKLHKVKQEKLNERQEKLDILYSNRRLIEDFSKRKKEDIDRYSTDQQEIIKKYFNKLWSDNNYSTENQALKHQSILAIKKINREIDNIRDNKSIFGIESIIKKLTTAKDFVQYIPNWRELLNNKIENEVSRRLKYKTKNLEKDPTLQKVIDFRDIYNNTSFFKDELKFERDFKYLSAYKKNIKKVFKNFDSSKEIATSTNTVEVLNNIINNNGKYADLAKSLLPFAEKNNVNIVVTNSKSDNSGVYKVRIGTIVDPKTEKPVASFVRDQIITLDGASTRFAIDPERLVLHEIIHSLSSIIIASEAHRKNGKDVFTGYLNYLRRKSAEFRDKSGYFITFSGPYGFVNPSELFSEALTNPEFREMLKLIPPTKSKKYSNFLEEFLDTVKEFLSKIFKTRNKEYANALEQLEDLMYNSFEAQSNFPKTLQEVLDSLEGDINDYKVLERRSQTPPSESLEQRVDSIGLEPGEMTMKERIDNGDIAELIDAVIEDSKIEIPRRHYKKLVQFQKAFPHVKVLFDYEMENRGEILGSKTSDYKALVEEGIIYDGQIVMKLNPNKWTNDTIIHEYGHLFIELLISQGRSSDVADAINRLRGSKLWDEVKAKYPDLRDGDINEENTLGKEVLATAIGLEGTEMYDHDNILVRLIKSFVDFINKLLGISTARMMARELISPHDDFESLYSPEETLEQKDTKSSVVNKINELFLQDKVNVVDDNFYKVEVGDRAKNLPRSTKYLESVFEELFTFNEDITAFEAAMRHHRHVSYKTKNHDKISRVYRKLSDAEKAIVDQTKRRFLNQWENNRDSGTDFHKLLEDLISSKGDISKVQVEAALKDVSKYPSLKNFNTGKKTIEGVYKIVSEIKQKEKQGYKVYNELRIYGNINGTDVGGTIDLLLVSPTGKVLIYDFKTTKGGEGWNDGYTKFKFPKHVAQLELYSQLLKSHGITVEDAYVIPITRDLENYEVVNLEVQTKKDIKKLNNDSIIDKNNRIITQGYTYQSIKNRLEGVVEDNFERSVELTRKRIEAEIKSINNSLEFELKRHEKLQDHEKIKMFSNMIKQNNEVIESLQNKEISLAIIDFLDLAKKRLNYHKAIVKDLKGPESVKYKNLIRSRNDIEVYQRMIEEILALEKENFDKDSFDKVQGALNTTLGQYSKTNNDIADLIIDKSAEVLAEHSGISEMYYRNKYVDEFKENNKVVVKDSLGIETFKTATKAPALIVQQLLKLVLYIPVKIITLGKGHLDFNITDYIPGLNQESTLFYIEGRKVTKDEYISSLNNYVQKKMIENKDQIKEVGIDVAKRYLVNGSAFYSAGVGASLINNATDPRGQKEYRTRAIINMVDTIRSANNLKVMDFAKRIQSEVTKMNLGNISDAKIFDDFIDDNGYFVTEYDSSFYEAYRKIESSDRVKWLEKNTITVQHTDSTGIVNTVLLPKEKWKSKKYDKVKNNNLYKLLLDKDNGLVRQIDDASKFNKLERKIFNPYKDGNKLHPSATFYNLPSISRSMMDKLKDDGFSFSDLKDFASDLTNFRPDDMRREEDPSSSEERERIKKIERDRKLNMQKLRNAKDAAERTRLLDIIEGQNKTLTKARFKNKKHYRGDLGDNRAEHLKKLSRNIVRSLMLDYKDALDFQLADNLSSTVDILDESLEIKLYKGENVGVVVEENLMGIIKKDWRETPVSEIFRNAVSQHVYREPVGEGTSAALLKSSDFARKYSRGVAMGLNYISQSMQWMMGIQDIKIDAIGGGAFNEENYNSAVEWYRRSEASSIADLGRNHMQSLTNLLKEEFRVDNLNLSFTNDRMIWKFAGHAGNILRSGEDVANHVAYGTLMYMVLDTYKAVDENGDFIDLKGNVTDKPISILHFYEKVVDVEKNGKIETVTLEEAKNSGYRIVKNTYLRLNNKVKGTNKANFNKSKVISIDGEIDANNFIVAASREIKEYGRRYFGNYEEYNKSHIGKMWWGPWLMMFKNWVEPAFRRRLEGGMDAFKYGPGKAKDKYAASQIFYDDILKSNPEGFHITLLRFLVRKLKHGEIAAKLGFFRSIARGLENMGFDLGTAEESMWKNLEPWERENIRKAVFEISLYATAKILLSLILMMWADDDKEKNEFFYYLMSLLKRVGKERGTVTPFPTAVNEAMFMLRNPVAGLNTYESLRDGFDYLFPFEDDDFYKISNSRYGVEKGDWKGWKHFQQMAPGWRILNRSNYDYLRSLQANKF